MPGLPSTFRSLSGEHTSHTASASRERGPRIAAARAAAIIGCLTVAAHGGAFASIAPEGARGFVPTQAYASGLTEDINLYNFNVVVALPLSPTYPVSERLSWGMTAYYNGGLRWGTSLDGSYSSFGQSLGDPDVHGWLGLGWRLDFGKVVNHVTYQSGACISTASDYVSPGGGVHPLSDSRVGFTRDGTENRKDHKW